MEYRESVFVGYRYYDSAKKPVRYPFGRLVGIPSFAYSNLRLSATALQRGETLSVTLDVSNTGARAGAVVQLYLAHRSDVMSCLNKTRGLKKYSCSRAGTRNPSPLRSRRDLCFYDVTAGDWRVEGGAYELRLSASSRDLRLTAQIEAEPDADAHAPDHRTDAPCYYDLSGGIDVPDDAFTAVLGRPIPPRERQEGEGTTLNATLQR
ncbi:MAG: hypothetical protein R2912_06505 [Eubacteriales bacterium]